MTPLADEPIAADHRTYERRARLVGALTDDQLTQPSGASGWTVAQVLSHLGSGAEITLETLRAGQAGTDRAADANQAVWARWNAMSPREQADGYVRAGAELDRAFPERDPAQRAELRVPMGFLPEPAGIDLFAGMRLNETALHSWDVEVAFDPTATVPGDVAAVLVEQYRGPAGVPAGLHRQDRPAGRPPGHAHRPHHGAGDHPRTRSRGQGPADRRTRGVRRRGVPAPGGAAAAARRPPPAIGHRTHPGGRRRVAGRPAPGVPGVLIPSRRASRVRRIVRFGAGSAAPLAPQNGQRISTWVQVTSTPPAGGRPGRLPSKAPWATCKPIRPAHPAALAAATSVRASAVAARSGPVLAAWTNSDTAFLGAAGTAPGSPLPGGGSRPPPAGGGPGAAR